MAGKADFTQEEWETMQKGATGAAVLVSMADPNFFDSFAEAGSIGSFLSGAREKGPSPFIRELAAVRGTGLGGNRSAQEVESATVEALRTSVATLQAKAPEEVDNYKEFVMALTDAVAKAAGGVVPSETAAAEKVRAALQTS
jgi:hypothetical protein